MRPESSDESNYRRPDVAVAGDRDVAPAARRGTPRSPARRQAPNPDAWLAIPELATLPTLPNVPIVPGPLNGGLAAAPPEAEATQWLSPARLVAPDTDAWLPIPDLRRLPAKQPAVRHGHPHGTRGPSGRPDRLPKRAPSSLKGPAPLVAQPHRVGEPSTAIAGTELLERAPELQEAKALPIVEDTIAALSEPQLLQEPRPIRRERSTDVRATRRRAIAVAIAAALAGSAWFVLPAFTGDEQPRVVVAAAPSSTSTPSSTSSSSSVAAVIPKVGSIVIVDGRRISVRTEAGTIADALAQAGVVLDADDEVSPALDTALTAGLSIVVVRVNTYEASVETIVEAPVERRLDNALPAGAERVLQEGVAGTSVTRFAVTTRDGVESARVPVGDAQIIAAPVPRIIAYGKPRPTPSTASSTSKPASSPVTASPGSSNSVPVPVTVALPPDTVKVAPQTPPSGTSETGQITHYVLPGAPGPGYCAHKTLPFGTVVTVTNLANGKSTTCIVKDRGPYGAGRILDLAPADFEKLAPLGQGVINGSISWQVQ